MANAIHPKFSPEYLRERLNYDPETGIFTWKTRLPGPGRGIVGKVAGFVHPRSGYRVIRLGRGSGRGYFAHVIAWAYMTGSWPDHMMDHKNMVRSDNRWENLRPATNSQNKSNSKMYRNNSTGYRGVSQTKEGRWYAQIQHNKKVRWLGTYDSPEEAHAVYKEWAIKLQGEFARY